MLLKNNRGKTWQIITKKKRWWEKNPNCTVNTQGSLTVIICTLWYKIDYAYDLQSKLEIMRYASKPNRFDRHEKHVRYRYLVVRRFSFWETGWGCMKACSYSGLHHIDHDVWKTSAVHLVVQSMEINYVVSKNGEKEENTYRPFHRTIALNPSVPKYT